MSEKAHEGAESMVGEVTKETALLLAGAADKDEEPTATVEELEYDEDVTAWAEAIQEWMQRKQERTVAIALLQKETGLSLVKLWLAGLLGEFEIEQRRGFNDLSGVVIGVGG